MTTIFRLAELLEARALSQRELARLAGISFVTVNRICRNTTAQVSLRTLDKLSTALGVAPGDLIMKKAPKRKGRQ